MEKDILLRTVLQEGCDARLVEEDIYSVMVDARSKHSYDNKAPFYDWVVGNYLYNRVMWGGRPRNYSSFACQALCDGSEGVALDAGCGSLLFTSRAYLASGRSIIACDESLDMLRRARWRLWKLGGGVRERVVLVQADLNEMAYRAGSFQTVLCMNVLHHCADAVRVAAKVNSLLAEGGQLYLTSLVVNGRVVGDWYVKRLHRVGWFAQPRTGGELRVLLQEALKTEFRIWAEGNMAYVTTTGEEGGLNDAE